MDVLALDNLKAPVATGRSPMCASQMGATHVCDVEILTNPFPSEPQPAP